MSDGAKIVVLGAAAQMPFAGVWWQVRHYLEGLRRLDHDVYYVEDSGNWPYDPVAETYTEDASGAVAKLSGLLSDAGFADRWAFANAAREGEVWGLGAERLGRLLAETDVLINLSGVTPLSEAHMQVPVRIYLETDPVTPQLEVAGGNQHTIEFLSGHTHYFTFGERIGQPDCAVPSERFPYQPTRQPVVLEFWEPPHWFPEAPPEGLVFTTIANWEQNHKDVSYQGETYTWSKSAEFLKLLEVPGAAGVQVRLALAISDQAAIDLLEAHRYEVTSAAALSDDPNAYRRYIRNAAAEFTAAKDQNVRLASGWFSDRTATFLAAGKPAVVQDTGFGTQLPTGTGLLSFNSPQEAVAGLQAVAADYTRHSEAAREIAAEHFRAETVLTKLLNDAGVR